MAHDTWEVTENDKKLARDSVELQFDALGVKDFIELQVEVVAALHAQTRFLQNIIHERMKG